MIEINIIVKKINENNRKRLAQIHPSAEITVQ
jgi:hypothetical protein